MKNKAFKLSDLEPKIKEEVEKQIKDAIENGYILEPTVEYNNFGLRFPIDYLMVLGKKVVLLPLETASQYCDEVCKEMVDNCKEHGYLLGTSLEEIKESFKNVEEFIMHMNCTAIGNLAYMYLYLDESYNELKELSKKLLDVVYEKESVKVVKVLEIIERMENQ